MILVVHLDAQRAPRALDGHSKGTQMALWHLRHSGACSIERHLDTKALYLSGTRTALRHSRHLNAQGTLFCRLLFDALCLLINAVVFFKMHYTFILCEFMDLYSFNKRFI